MGGGTCTSEGNYKMSEVITKQKILIADDSEMNRELLAAILEGRGDFPASSGYCYAPHGWFRGSFLYE